jgi:hypothetical protein
MSRDMCERCPETSHGGPEGVLFHDIVDICPET